MTSRVHPGSPRLAWEGLPAHVRAEVERALGSTVVRAETKHGGFSPGVAAVLDLADGSRAFVKSAGVELNPESPSFHRREASVMSQLPEGLPAPTLRAVLDDGDWVTLVFDAVDGRMPHLPWDERDLERVLAALCDLATVDARTLRPFVDVHDHLFHGWRSLRDAPPATLDDWSIRHLEVLADREPAWRDAAAGDALVHADVRADNVLLIDDGVVFVDWAHASHGAPWLDLVIMLPALELGGGPDHEAIWATHPLAVAADREAVDAMAIALAGFFTYAATLPPVPGLPTIREFQAAQGALARRWVAQRLGLDHP